jgi:NAD(P)-dependent dehydrogenase (short-subunit alcohol dehydrogenase family)
LLSIWQSLSHTIRGMDELSGQVAIVTGAGGGIGSATVARLARHGADIVAVDVERDPLAAVVTALAQGGRRCEAIELDLVAESAGQHIVDRAVGAFGRIDIIVNNAATGTRQQFADFTADAFDRVIAVNLRTPFLLCQAAAPHMIAAGRGGRIVNVTSAAGFRATMTDPIYAASKAGLDAVTRSLAAALGPSNINVNAVAPGLTSSRMGRRLGDGAEMQAAVESGPLANLLHRVSTPDDVAEVIVFLCLPASRQITAQTIHTSAGNVV